MAWQDDMIEVLRVLVNDLDSPPTYSDDKLERVLVVAALQVLQEVSFSQAFAVSLARGTIAPDPTAAATADESFVNMTCLKAACIMDRSSAIVAANRAVSAREGGSSFDLTGIFAAKVALLEKGWCAVYEDAKFEYKLGRVAVAGAAVMTPFRLYAFGEREVF
jgi:hypothetical protein